jgi:hypothetical protein
MKTAKEPFEFVAASYLIRVRPERARNLGEMARFLRSCSEESIFYHTFQSLETHHYTSFSSDFAQWILAACNEAALAESLATLDLRSIVSLPDLREAIAGRIERHCRAFPESAERPAFEPFHFCEAIEVTVPLDTRARNLVELGDGIRRLSLHTLHYHFISSRLRLRLRTNDFSHWIHFSLGFHELADRVNSLDIYTNTLEGLRDDILAAIGEWRDE